MNVLTLSRQVGSEGDWVAREVARVLGFSYMDHEIINRAAREARVPAAALAHIDELGFLGLKPSPQDHRAYLNKVESILRELADRGGVVIVGCGGQMVLADHPQAVHVQIVAPSNMRLARLMRQEGIPKEAAVNRLLACDRRRADYLKRNYGVNWLNRDLYDLILDTKKITREAAAACIVQLLQAGNLIPDRT